MDVLRWGRSAYETDHDLSLERQAAERLGLGWRLREDRAPPPDLDDVGALVVNSRVRVDDAVLARFSGSLVLTTTSGWDHVDVAAAEARGVTVARLPEARRDAVVAHTLAAMIGLMRRFPTLQQAALDGRWARGDLPSLGPVGLDHATVAVIGVGVIGRRVLEVLRPLGCRILAVDPAGVPEGVERCELDEALERCDAVTLHCALGPGTEHLLSDARLARLRPHAVVVNTARGRILDVTAAVGRVADGRLRGLHADVFPEEPWPDLAAHASVPGVWLTPHAAGYTADLGRRVADGVATVLEAWHAGAPTPWTVPSPTGRPRIA